MSMRKRQEIQKVLRGIENGENKIKESRPLRIAGIQFSAGKDCLLNLHRSIEFAHVALDKGAKIVCFSELFTLPWFNPNNDNYTNYAETIPGPTTDKFLKLAEEYRSVILCPIYEIDGESFYNSTAVIGPHEIVGVYRKTHVPDFPFWEERKFFTAGNTLPVFDINETKIGILMSWDNFFPESTRILAMKDAELIFAPTAAAFDSQFRWESVIRANAVMNNLFIFRINRVGEEAPLHFYGKSFCVDPFGEYIVEPVFHKDAVMVADVDLNAVSISRNEFPFLRECRDDIYRLDEVTID